MAYLLAFLDRGNIGNAKVAGLLDSIPMSDAIYNTGKSHLSSPHFPSNSSRLVPYLVLTR
jgi:hypothetical protein